MKFIACIAVVALIGTLGCDDPGSDERVDSTADDSRTAQIDDYLHSDDWPDQPKRIVSMAPNVTELLFELGLGERVVAVTRYCDWPDEVDDLPTVGGMLDPDFEAILGAEPDVVVGVTEGLDDRTRQRFDHAGVSYGFVSIEDLDSVVRGAERLGEWFDGDAERFVDEFERRLRSASERLDESLDIDDASTLLVVDRDPLVAAGPGSFGDDLLDYAGLQNALAGDTDDYPILDIEQVVRLDPDLIIDTTIEADNTESERYWQQFESLTAVDSDRVVHLDDTVMMRPGPRVPNALDRLGQSLESL